MINKLKELGIALFIAKAIEVMGIRLADKIKKRRYSKHKTSFRINVDDDFFEMSFQGYEIGKAIQERIEGVRETETTSIIKGILRPGNRVLEIGGCYGYFTMLMANAVSPNGRVVSIEGLSSNFEILKHNIVLNRFNNVEYYNYFIGNNNENAKYSSVESVNISKFLDKIQFEPTHIFMDIEGFEVEAIEQLCGDYLDRHSPTLIFEHHEFLYSPSKGLKYIREMLKREGYLVRKVYGNIVAFKEQTG